MYDAKRYFHVKGLTMNVKHVVIAVVLIMSVYHWLVKPSLNTQHQSVPPISGLDIENKRLPAQSRELPLFRCDHRQHCSQMRSLAEAEFFHQYCPNTKMDGDNDGFPCERQARQNRWSNE